MTNKLKGLFEDELIEVRAFSQTSTKYSIDLTGEIGETSLFRNVLDTLEHAGEGDLIEFRIDSIGGDLYAMNAICNAILSTEATTCARLIGLAASAATLPLMVCDEVIIENNTQAMFHTASYGARGDTGTVKEFVAFSDSSLRELLWTFYEGFLTKKEFKNMVDNHKEYWMKGDEVLARLQARTEYFKKKLGKKQKAV